jgi:hypothetical protein
MPPCGRSLRKTTNVALKRNKLPSFPLLTAMQVVVVGKNYNDSRVSTHGVPVPVRRWYGVHEVSSVNWLVVLHPGGWEWVWFE